MKCEYNVDLVKLQPAPPTGAYARMVGQMLQRNAYNLVIETETLKERNIIRQGIERALKRYGVKEKYTVHASGLRVIVTKGGKADA